MENFFASLQSHVNHLRFLVHEPSVTGPALLSDEKVGLPGELQARGAAEGASPIVTQTSFPKEKKK